MRVMFVCYHAYPDFEVGARRVSELANDFLRSGWRVSYVSGQFDERRGADCLDSRIRCIRIQKARTFYDRFLRHLVPSPLRSSHVSQHESSQGPSGTAGATRGLALIGWIRRHYHQIVDVVDNFKRWSMSVMWVLELEMRQHRPDIVICSGPPFSPALATAVVCRRHGVPMVIDMRDPWSDRPDLGFSDSSLLARWLDRRFEGFALNRAAAIVVTTRRLQERLLKRYAGRAKETIVCIRNGFDVVHVMDRAPPTGVLRLLFAGSIYYNRNPMPFLRALKMCLDANDLEEDKVRVDFVGNCGRWKGVDLRVWVAENGLGKVVYFSEPISSSQLREQVRQANVLLNFAQGQKEQVPAKVFEQIASRRSVLALCETDSETAEVLSSYPLAHVVSDDSDEIRRVLIALFDKHARDGAESIVDMESLEQYSRRCCAGLYRRLAHDVVGRAQTGSR